MRNALRLPDGSVPPKYFLTFHFTEQRLQRRVPFRPCFQSDDKIVLQTPQCFLGGGSLSFDWVLGTNGFEVLGRPTLRGDPSVRLDGRGLEGELLRSVGETRFRVRGRPGRRFGGLSSIFQFL